MFIFGSQNLNNYQFFKLSIFFPISFTNWLRMLPWTAGKNCGYQVFLQFQQFYFAIWLAKCLCETQLAQFFKFLDSKNKNANNKIFSQKFLLIQKTNTFAKTFAYTKKEYENEKFLRYPFACLWNKKWNYFSYFNHNSQKCKHNLV